MLMKKHFRKLLLLAMANLLLPPLLRAETRSPYEVDFSTSIAVVDHSFKVSTGWGHIVESYDAGDGYSTDTYWVSYSYRTSGGVDDSACLYAGTQKIGYTAQYWGEDDDKKDVNDLLVTPAVSGEVSIMVKANNASRSSIKIYKVNDDNTFDKYNPIKEITASELSTSGYTPVTFTVDTPTKVGIRASEAYLDNFSAASADIVLTKGMRISYVYNDYYSYDFVEQPDGTVKYTNPSTKEDGFRVAVTNSGDLDLVQNEENFSVALCDVNGNALGEPTYVPQDLAVGCESGRFLLSGVITPGDFWKNTSAPTIYVKENLTGSMQKIGTAYFVPYEAKFTFRLYDGYGNGSISDAQALGVVVAGSAKQYELYNDGSAPLQIVSMTMPDGFTCEPEQPFEVASKAKQTVTIVAPQTPGSYSPTLTIEYKLKPEGETKTYTLPFTANVIKEGTWSADFNNSSSSIVYPEGSVAEGGITSDNKYVSTQKYEIWLKSFSSTEYAVANNKFITPRLSAEVGETMTFDVAYDKDGSEHFVKVYLSTDRLNWSGPVAEVTLTSADTSFETKSFTVENAGEYYVGFAVFGAKLDNIAGFTQTDMPAHDLYETAFSIDAKKLDGNGNVYNGEVEYATQLIPVVGQGKGDYTLQFCMEADGNVETTDVNPVNLTQSSKSTTKITVKHTSAYEKTTKVKAYFLFSFTDGATLRTPEHEFTVSVEPDFLFLKSDFYPNYRPDTNESTPMTFGKVNQATVDKSFAIANWGTAPLSVTSITVPDGFSLNATEATVAPKERYVIEVTFNPETPGTYGGDLTITYLDGAGESRSHTIAVSGTMLDPAKWFASFEDAEHPTSGAWPAGVVHDTNVQLYNAGTGDKPNMGAITYSATKNWLTTPALEAAAGDQLIINAMSNRSYNRSALKVYASATRKGLKEEASRTLLLTVDELPYGTLTDYTVTFEEAGTYFIGIELGAYAVVADIYGLAVKDGFRDLELLGASISQTQMQNVATDAKMQLRNYGTAPETDYEVFVHVGDGGYSVPAPAEIPVNHLSEVLSFDSDATTELTIPLRWPEIGTFPVYLEFKSGDYSIATEPVDVTFTEELPTGEAVVGTPNGFNSNIPVKYNYRNSETVMLFTADELGLAEGTKISSLVFKGYSSAKNQTTVLKVYCDLTDETSVAQPAYGNLDVTGLTNIIDEKHVWAEAGTEKAPVDQLVINFAEPLVYEAGKSLKLVVCSYMPYNGSGNARSIYFESTSDNANCYMAYSDTQATEADDRGKISASWSKYNCPVLHVNYVLDPVTVEGNVTLDGAAVEGATVTFISEDGDNVRYSTTTQADGTYALKVIQNERVYTAQAEKEGKMDLHLGVTTDASATLDFALATCVVLDDDAEITDAATGAVVLVDIRREAGFNAVVLPMELTLDEIKEIFGTAAEVFEFQGMAAGDDATAWFKPSAVTYFAAGTPLLIHSGDVSGKLVMRGKDIVTEATPVVKDEVTFTGVFGHSIMEQGMFHVNSDNWREYVEDAPSAALYSADDAESAVAEDVRPFTAVIKTAKDIQALEFVTSDKRPTGVENVSVDAEYTEDVIYNLQGIRVYNPSTGIYIVNGKKTYIRK